MLSCFRWGNQSTGNLPTFTQLARDVDSIQTLQLDLRACPLLHGFTLSHLCLVFMISTFISQCSSLLGLPLAARNREQNSSGLNIKVFSFLHIRKSSSSDSYWHWISDSVVSGLTPFSLSFPQGPRMAAAALTITSRFTVGREKDHTSLILFRKVKIFPQSPSPGTIDFCSGLLGWSYRITCPALATREAGNMSFWFYASLVGGSEREGR